MFIFRHIFAVLLIALLPIGNLVEAAAHVGMPNCEGGHCADMVAQAAPEMGAMSRAEPLQAASGMDYAAQECCDLSMCFTALFGKAADFGHPLGLHLPTWGQFDPLVAVHWPSTLERPPNMI